MESGCIFRIRLTVSDSIPFFQRRPGSYCTKQTGVWSGWPGQVLVKAHLVQRQTGVQESSGPVITEHNRPAARFPVSDSTAFFHRRYRSYRAKPAPIWFGCDWLCQVLAKRIRSGSKPMCKGQWARFWPALLGRSGSEANRIRHVHWVVCWFCSDRETSITTRDLQCVFAPHHNDSGLLSNRYYTHWQRRRAVVYVSLARPLWQWLSPAIYLPGESMEKCNIASVSAYHKVLMTTTKLPLVGWIKKIKNELKIEFNWIGMSTLLCDIGLLVIGFRVLRRTVGYPK